MKDRERFVSSFDVSRETLERLDIYADLLRKWNPSINLVAKSTLGQLWERHFFDSAQILEVSEQREGRWVDLGTGGGFPGLIVAILAANERAGISVTCIESDLRKAVFLQTVIREVGIKATVLSDRIEDIPPLSADVVSARALAPLSQLLGYAERHLAENGKAIFLKGAKVAREVKEALETWSFELDTYPSKTDPEASILKIGDIRRV
jgi:16S rRNA (guanine527-N7)-methyltransferase